MEYFGFDVVKVIFASNDSTGKAYFRFDHLKIQDLFLLDIGIDTLLKLQDGSAVGLHKFMLQAHASSFMNNMKSNDKWDIKPDTFNVIKDWIYTGCWKSVKNVTISELLDLHYWTDKLNLDWLKWKTLQLLYSIIRKDVPSYLLIFKYACDNGLNLLEQMCLSQVKNYQFSDQQLDQFMVSQLEKVSSYFSHNIHNL